MWRPFARAPLRSYFHDPQKNEIYFLNEKSLLISDQSVVAKL